MSYFEDLLDDIKQKQRPVDTVHYKMLSESGIALKQPSTVPAERVKPVESLVRAGNSPMTMAHNRLNHKEAIFRVFARQSDGVNVGSGFFYAASGEFMTDLHVVGEANTCQVLLNNGQVLKAVVDRRDHNTDLASGHVVEPKKSLPYLILEKPASVETYTGKTYSAGYPDGREFTIVPGNTSKLSFSGIASAGALEIGENPSRTVIVTDIETRAGMSGGVLFNKDFLPIGIIDKGTKPGSKSPISISTPITDGIRMIKQPVTYKLESKF
ncbi:MAG: serine protease [Candidatus Obscuribacterales bacterium]|nr:serine protease [Candidatus Obscuribacterales bacterium]